MTNLTHNSFSICLFQFSTCFEQPRAHQLYQYNIWYVSVCVGDRLVCRSGRSLCVGDRLVCRSGRFLPYLFSICLFQFSTCFEQPRVHHQENQLYQYNIWYVSVCVGDRLVYSSFPTCILDGYLHRVTHTRCCIDTIDSPDNEHEVARNM
jgi:hypothetical protein